MGLFLAALLSGSGEVTISNFCMFKNYGAKRRTEIVIAALSLQYITFLAARLQKCMVFFVTGDFG